MNEKASFIKYMTESLIKHPLPRQPLMGILTRIRQYISVFEQEDIYCQNCGDDITEKGGDVTKSGNIYCTKYKGDNSRDCFVHAVFNGKESGFNLGTFYNADKVQRAIQDERVTSFDPLEMRVERMQKRQ